MFDHTLSLPCVYSSIFNVVFTAKYKKQYLHVHWQKIAQEARKIAQTCLRSLHVFPTMQHLDHYHLDHHHLDHHHLDDHHLDYHRH